MTIDREVENFVPGTSLYVPADEGNSFIAVGCVSAGDRWIHKLTTYANVGAGNDIVPDPSSGLLPHIAYRPTYWRMKSIVSVLEDGCEGGVHGNDPEPPCIRVDLGTIYCPWNGAIKIEGGGSVPGTPPVGGGGPTGPGALLISYLWDRSGARRDVIRTSVDQRGRVRHTFTLWNTPDGGSVTVPTFASSLSVVSPQLLRLDSGAGTFAVPMTLDPDREVSLGPFTRVSVTGTCPALIFGIWL